MPGIAPPDQQDDGGFVGGDGHAGREQQEHDGGVQRRAEPVREAVQLGDADEMTHDRDDREDDDAEHDGGLQTARALPGPERGQQEGERSAEGSVAAVMGAGRPGKIRESAAVWRGNSSRSMWRSTPNRYSATMSAASSVDTIARSCGARARAQVRGEQARAGEQEQHRGERLGRQDELRQRQEAPDGEHVAAEHGDPERDRRRRRPPGAPGASAGACDRAPGSLPPGSPRSLRPSRAPPPPGETRRPRSRRAREDPTAAAAPRPGPGAARCRSRASRPPRPGRGPVRPARPGGAAPGTSAGGSRPSRRRPRPRPGSHPSTAASAARAVSARASRTSRSTEPSSRSATSFISGPTVMPCTTSVPSTTEKAVKRMKSR